LKITAEKDQQSQYIVTIEIEPAELEEAKGKAAKKLANQVRIPGFRPGKAPRALVERFVGQESLVQQATQDLFPKAYQNAIKQEDIKPIADPQFDIKSTDPLILVATIPVEPTVELGDYKEIRFELPPVNVTDEDVTKVLEQLQDQQSTWEEPETERPAQDGDQVELDLQTIRDGELVGEPTQRSGVLGKGELLHAIDEQIVGMSVGEERTVEVKRPSATPVVAEEPASDETAEEDAEATEAPTQEAATPELPEVETIPLDEEEEAATAPLTFKVVLNSVKVKHVPELNDEFAESVSDVKTVDELKIRIRSNLENQQDATNKRELTEKIIKEAVALSTIVMPPILIDSEIHALENGMAERLKQQKLSLDQYLQFTGKNHEQFHEELRPQAEDRLKTALVLREIARAEGITVEDGELDREVEKMVDQYTLDAPEEEKEQRSASVRGFMRQEQSLNSLKDEIFSRKLADRLLELSAGVKPAENTAVEELDFPEKTDDERAELSLEVDSPSVTGETEASPTNEAAPVEEEADEAPTEETKPARKSRAKKAEATE